MFCQHHWGEPYTVSPVRLELTPFCAAPNHPRGLYYEGLAAHLTPQKRRGAGGEIGTSDPLSFHMVRHHTHITGTHTGSMGVQQGHCDCVPHQITDRAPDLMSVCRRETDKEVTVAAALTYSTNHLTPLYVCYRVMLMSLLQGLSEVNPQGIGQSSWSQ